MASDVEVAAMRQAIVLSALGLGTTSPNPPVGCVILSRHGRVVGAGFHRRKGEAHAEVHALNAAGSDARGGTAVVTLEPCNHVGVTPACHQELIGAGITRVVLSVVDPTSRGAGGAAELAAAGVDVETGILHEEALAVLGSWLTATVRRRPFLIWAHPLGEIDDYAMNEQLTRDLRGGVDVIVASSAPVEGVPGGHATQHFRLPGLTDRRDDMLPWLVDAYALGARSVVLVGAAYGVHLSQQMHVVDNIVVAVRRTDPSQALTAVDSHIFSAGFGIVGVTSGRDSLLIHLRRLGDDR